MEMKDTTAKRWLNSKREQIINAGTIEVDVFVRSLSPPLGVRQRQEQILGRIGELQEAGLVDSFQVNLWGEGVCLCDTCSETSVAESMLDNVERLEEWAAQQGDVSLPIERRQVDSMVLSQTSRDLILPSICLRITADTEIAAVFPCTVADESISVTDVVELLTEAAASGTEQTVSRDRIVQI